MKKVLLFSFLLFLTLFNRQQANAQNELLEVTFEEADSLLQIENKPVLVFLYTDWCKYCHSMKATVFNDSTVIKYLNGNFYLVWFNAESNEPVSFAGKTFYYQPNGSETGVHDLAAQLGTIDGKLNYPTLSVLNEKYEILFQNGGVLYKEELMAVLESI
jgi:thioredoxin-related protein